MGSGTELRQFLRVFLSTVAFSGVFSLDENHFLRHVKVIKTYETDLRTRLQSADRVNMNKKHGTEENKEKG